MVIVMIAVVDFLKRKVMNEFVILTGEEKIVMGLATMTVAPCLQTRYVNMLALLTFFLIPTQGR